MASPIGRNRGKDDPRHRAHIVNGYGFARRRL
jgi:hypothetical protein